MSTISATSSSTKSVLSYKVYFDNQGSLIELKFTDYRMRVEEVIFECIRILEDEYLIKLNNNVLHYALYPAQKNGKKGSDSMEISHMQRVKSVGVRKFYL
jgi:hypothetical protein